MQKHPDGQRTSPPRNPAVDLALKQFKLFAHSQVIGGIVLLICALTAIIWANSAASDSYFALWQTELGLSLGHLEFSLSLKEWMNEVLMMAFFLLIGLEVKEQMLVGELAAPRKALLPICSALGGMILPGLIYFGLTQGTSAVKGWGIPTATDIAFALGILALLGKRIPLSLKIFLATLAIADDIGAIIIISIFYAEGMNPQGLLIALFFWLMIFGIGRMGIYNTLLFFMLSVGVWFGFMNAGIHATIAGVAVAMAIPARSLIDGRGALNKVLGRLDMSHLSNYDILRDHRQKDAVTRLNVVAHDMTPPLVKLADSLQPWVSFVVMPLFVLANAGVSLEGNLLNSLSSPISISVILGLTLGKPLGIVSFTWLAIRSGLAVMPQGLRWIHIIGMGMLAGVGFTMSLFVTELAFAGLQASADSAKLGIIIASMLSSIGGALVLLMSQPMKPSGSLDTAAIHQNLIVEDLKLPDAPLIKRV